MFYTLGFMKCIIAPTFGAIVWSSYVFYGWLFLRPTLNEATFVGLGMALASALAVGFFCHYTRGVLRCAGLVAVCVLGVWLFPPFFKAFLEYSIYGYKFGFPVNTPVIAAILLGSASWVVLYPREVLSIGASVKAAEIVIVLEEAERIERERQESVNDAKN